MRQRFKFGERYLQVDVLSNKPLRVNILEDEQGREVAFQQFLSEGRGRIQLADGYHPYFVTASSSGVWVTLAGRTFFFENSKGSSGGEEEHGGFKAPMPGKVIAVAVSEGDHVEKGQILVLMEAMKMEHRIEAPAAGKVTRLFCAQGDLVDQSFQLLEFEVNHP